MRKSLSALILPALATIGSCVACYLAAGASLDFFIGSAIFAALFCPLLTAASSRDSGAWAVAVTMAVEFAVCWRIAGAWAGIGWGQWICSWLVLAATLGLMTAATRLLLSLRLPPFLAVAIVTTAQVLWLTWPVWLSVSIPGAKLSWSVSLHPLLVLNGILKDLGIWTEQPIAYNLTTLGQDVQYRLPTSAWPTVGVHLVVISLLTAMTFRRSRSNPNTTRTPWRM